MRDPGNESGVLYCLKTAEKNRHRNNSLCLVIINIVWAQYNPFEPFGMG